jgi:hypothetical protein
VSRKDGQTIARGGTDDVNMGPMRVRRMFAAILLAICIGAPVLEMFDRWDQTLQDGNDSESNLVVMVLCVGVGFVAATAVLRRVRPALTGTLVLRSSSSSQRSETECRTVLPIFGASSPPATLRI